MDIAAAGAAAAQINNAQRAQKISMASLRQAGHQGLTLANLIAQAASVGQSAAPAAGGSAPISGITTGQSIQAPSSDQTPPNPNLPRGSLVNILA
jgi:hypothetical protein